MARGAHPYDVSNYIELQQTVTSDPPPQLPRTTKSGATAKRHVVWGDGSSHSGFSAPLTELVAGMLVKDPKRRLSASQLLRRPCMRACAVCARDGDGAVLRPLLRDGAAESRSTGAGQVVHRVRARGQPEGLRRGHQAIAHDRVAHCIFSPAPQGCCPPPRAAW